jgi:hypothetical protein
MLKIPKSYLLISLLLILSTTLLSAKKPEGKKIVVHGYLVDIACILERNEEKSELGKIHTKKCLQMPACERSGYAVMDSKDNLYKFDETGNTLAKKFISETNKEKDWRVVVSGRLQGEQLVVAKLQLQK